LSISTNIEIENKLEELLKVARFTQEFSVTNNLSIDCLSALNLSLEECLTNTMKYGYSDSSLHKINVELWIDKYSVRVRITDDGLMFNPFISHVPKLDVGINEQNIGGLGVHLVKNIMDSYQYFRIENKNIILLTKHQTKNWSDNDS